MRLGSRTDAGTVSLGPKGIASSKRPRDRFPVAQEERNKDKRSSYGESEAVRL
jgi:hypothetical protein